MPEPIEQTPEALEIATLRRVNAELVTRHTKDKALIEELQAGTATLQAKLTETSESLAQATISLPLQMMAEELSTVPELFLEQFSKHFKVDSVKGVLTLQTQDGKPALDKDGNAIPFERDALTKLLTEGDDVRAQIFRKITIGSRASGGLSISTHQRTIPAKGKMPQFGLR